MVASDNDSEDGMVTRLTSMTKIVNNCAAHSQQENVSMCSLFSSNALIVMRKKCSPYILLMELCLLSQ